MTESTSNTELSIRLVIPGDSISEIKEIGEETNVIIGPGLSREGSEVFANRCGILRQKKTSTKVAVFWVDCHSKRYVATRGENVIGVVVGKGMDSFRVSPCQRRKNALVINMR